MDILSALAPEATASGTDEDDGVAHLWCCNPELAWCGAKIDADWGDEIDEAGDPDDCALCHLAGQKACARCGWLA